MSEHTLWYKDAIIYEARVRAFFDSDGDGIGDFRGLAKKLDYLHGLGVDALWLLPFYPSPLIDDGYDISNYTSVHPDCGTLADFKRFVREAHDRGLRVITELVLNHTSDQHPWFQKARAAQPGSKWRDYYVWTDDPEKYSEARIIFKDFEPSNWTWDREARAYYWHRFYANQPDLNFENSAVKKAMIKAVDFWLDLGVDGLRLDAVPYLYEEEGTNCENLPATHAFLRELRAHVDGKYPDRMLLAEANQWPEDAVAYFGDGDECHMAFHFPIMPRLFMSVHMEDRFPIVDILDQTPAIPDTSQWALFLRNHDELTLEMVTDEERDYMYRVYADDRQARINLGIRRRLAPLLRNDRRRIELLNGLLFSLPGTPVLYYGDEIGMGDNIYLGDRNGVRTPMQWSSDRNAGFSKANPQRLYLPVVVDPEFNYETVNVEAQEHNRHSLLWWTRRLIALRKRFRAFSRGTIEFLHPSNRKVLAFLRQHEDEEILVVANLSRFVQYVELDLARFRGKVAVELFGDTRFPPIGDLPYLLTLGPHSFYWFALRAPERDEVRWAPATHVPDRIDVAGSWQTLLKGDDEVFTAALGAWLVERRWYGGKARRVQHLTIEESIPLPADGQVDAALTLVGVEYVDGPAERYVVPLAFASAEQAMEIELHASRALVARISHEANGGRVEGVVFDAMDSPAVCRELLGAIDRRRRIKGGTAGGAVTGGRTRAFGELAGADPASLRPEIAPWEQSNTSVLYGEGLILKLFRRIDEGINPDLEIGRFLTEQTDFAHTPRVAGYLELQQPDREPTTLAILQERVRNEGDAWRYTLDEVERFFERALTTDYDDLRAPDRGPFELVDTAIPDRMAVLLGAYRGNVELLGRRTAELHAALASGNGSPDLAPEPFTRLYQRSLYQSMRNMATRVFHTLDQQVDNLEGPVAGQAEALRSSRSAVMDTFRAVADRRMDAVRLRTHGDYHLGQVLYTGRDFVILDFEGEPARPLGERRIKRCALADVAGMLRSFDYAASTVFATRVLGGMIPADDAAAVQPLVQLWRTWVSATFLHAYFETAAGAPFLPADRESIGLLLNAFLLEKAIYEVGYELNSRPEWAWIPIDGALRLLEKTPR